MNTIDFFCYTFFVSNPTDPVPPLYLHQNSEEMGYVYAILKIV